MWRFALRTAREQCLLLLMGMLAISLWALEPLTTLVTYLQKITPDGPNIIAIGPDLTNCMLPLHLQQDLVCFESKASRKTKPEG